MIVPILMLHPKPHRLVLIEKEFGLWLAFFCFRLPNPDIIVVIAMKSGLSAIKREE
jgi:hypothetical protein